MTRTLMSICILLILVEGIFSRSILRDLNSKIDKIVIFLDLDAEDEVAE